MDYREIIKECVIELESKSFLYLKDTLIADYFDFKFIQDGSITREILAEKITDYFEKVELKNNKKFEKILEFYFNHLENFVAKRVPEKTTRKNKDITSVIVPRTKRYFEKAKQLRALKFNNVRQIIDYNRILMCLLVEIVKQNNKEVTNFDFSTRCLDEMIIIPCMESILEEFISTVEELNKKTEQILKIEDRIHLYIDEEFNSDNENDLKELVRGKYDKYIKKYPEFLEYKKFIEKYIKESKCIDPKKLDKLI